VPETLSALAAFVAEHRRCGELDGGGDDGHVWMACDCGASIASDPTTWVVQSSAAWPNAVRRSPWGP